MEKNESVEQFGKWLQRRFPGRRTSKDYISDVRQFLGFVQKELRDVTMHDIDGFVDQQRGKGLKMTTVNRRVAALKTFFDFLAEESEDVSWLNPVRFKRHAGKRGRSLPRDLQDEQIEQVWNEIHSARDRAWFALMVRGGLRVGEVVGLTLSDVQRPANDSSPARLRVKGKGQKERMVCLSGDAYATLERWLTERGETEAAEIFLNEKGKRLSTSGIEWLLHGYGRAVGIELTPHQLRHTFARQLTEAGMPVTSLSKLLGHAQITTTQIYTAGADPELAQAYQQAMCQLEPSTLSNTLSHAGLPPPEPQPVEAVPQTVVEPDPPDWQAWGKQLPPAIQHASIQYVQHLWGTWPVKRRRRNALDKLSELAHLWAWFLAYRPITHPGQLSLKDLHAYQADQVQRKYAAGTINRRCDYILGLLRMLADRDEPVDNSVFRLRYLRRPDSLPRHLSEAETRQLEAYLNQRMDSPDPNVRLENACLWLMLHSGLRCGECTDLLNQDLDLHGQRLIVRQGKGQKDRLVYLSQHTCLALQRYLHGASRRPTDPLWRYPSGQPMSIYWLRSHLAAIGKQLGIEPLYPHRLRHTCATRLLNAGMDITRIQKLLGHEMLATTMIYARVQDNTLERDYRQAMAKIERQQMPLCSSPILMEDWPIRDVKVHLGIDDSV